MAQACALRHRPQSGHRHGAVSQLVYLTSSVRGWDLGCSFGHAQWSGDGACQAAAGALPLRQPHMCMWSCSPPPAREPAPGQRSYPYQLEGPSPHPDPTPAGLDRRLRPRWWRGRPRGVSPPKALSAQHLPRPDLDLRSSCCSSRWAGRCLGREGQHWWSQLPFNVGDSGHRLLQPPDPLAVLKNKATYKNIYILTPHKLQQTHGGSWRRVH